MLAKFKPLKRGMQLIQEQKIMDAYEFFSAFTTAAAVAKSTPDATAVALSNLCQTRLGQRMSTDIRRSRSGSAVITDLSPVEHMMKALSLDLDAAPTSPARSVQRQLKLDRQVSGQAIAYLMHPAVSAKQLPNTFSDQIMEVLSKRTSTDLTPVEKVVPVDTKALATSEMARWKKTAEKSATLAEVLKMIGLHEIKRQMFALYNEVTYSKLVCILFSSYTH